MCFEPLIRHFTVPYRHQVVFTRDAFDADNPTLAKLLEPSTPEPARMLAFIDTHVAQAAPHLPSRLRDYARAYPDHLSMVDRVQPVPGGELCKNDRDSVYRVLNRIEAAGIDRQSYVLVIGGGAVLDCVGFAAAIAHRGVRLIRMPTTTLAQADSGVGVKNAINGFNKKNYLGSFAPPWAVINDDQLLITLPDRDWVSGFSEAVKVALLKDAAFFEQIEDAAPAIVTRDLDAAMPIVRKSAQLHIDHIALGGDPFELTSARPLDFGHWAAHRLETMTDYQLSHGEAVAIGLAIDVRYAARIGLLDDHVANRVLACLASLNLPLYHPAMQDTASLLRGIEHFREHLGGRLTLTLLHDIAHPVDVHDIDLHAMHQAIESLADASTESMDVDRLR